MNCEIKIVSNFVSFLTEQNPTTMLLSVASHVFYKADVKCCCCFQLIVDSLFVCLVCFVNSFFSGFDKCEN